MDGHTLFTELKKILADLYLLPADAQRVASDAGLNLAQIPFDAKAINTWHNLLAVAIRSGALTAVLDIALDEYGQHQPLVTICARYRDLMAAGGHLDAPPLLTDHQLVVNQGNFFGRDKIVQGDEVHGDKHVTYQLPHPTRIPLQRPPRAPHFQDRKDDLAQLLADLQAGRVVTLCGPGGIGKSALAAEAVWHLAPAAAPPARFPDGILFHSFYNQPQAALALEHIARSFGEEIKPTPHAAAQRALAGRRALLLLDGAEDADDLRQVLAVCDQCSVVVTSRQRRDQVDKRQDVAPLPLADAVALLQAWGGARASDEAATPRIAELVGRLPLALRLVGRYLAQHEEAAADYLTWLEKTPLTALDQGQRRAESIPLLLDRSLAQVSATARQVLGLVGLLALAPFTREAITSALALADDASRTALGELVNYGLLLRPAEHYEVTHALIHTYARLQLPPAPEETARLAVYYKTFINDHQGKFAQLHTIRPHVLALIHSCRAREDWAAVRSLSWAMDDYLNLQGYWTDRIFVIEHNLAAARATADRQEEGVLLGNLGNVYYVLGQVEGAIAYHQQALVIFRAIGDRRNEGAWLGGLGLGYYALGQVEGAIAYYQQALVIARAIGDRRNEGAWLGNLGAAYGDLGQVEGAVDYFQQALVISRAIGDRRSEGNHLGNLGLAYAALGQVAEAVAYHQQALIISREIGDRHGEGADLGHLGLAYAALGQVAEAIDYYRQALVIAREIGDRRSEGTWLGNLGNGYAALGQVEGAVDYYQQALVIARAIGDRRNEGTLLGNLGGAYADLGQEEQARQYLLASLRILEEIKSPNADTVRQRLASLPNEP